MSEADRPVPKYKRGVEPTVIGVAVKPKGGLSASDGLPLHRYLGLFASLVVTLVIGAGSAFATDIYADARTGQDSFNGRSQRHPVKSLARAVSLAVKPGDRILLRSGSQWSEPLILKHSGKPGHPIVIDRYDVGLKPRIDTGGIAENAVTIRNVDYITVKNLELTNHGDGEAVRRGVLISADNIGELHDITVSDLYIHDVNGTNAAKETGGIAFQTLGARTPSRFIGLHIQRNILWKVDRTAIVGQSDQLARSTWFPSLEVVIKDNYAEDVGGDGIVPWATDGALVEHNIVRHAVQRAPGYNAGIWPWSTDNTVVQLNEAAFTKGTLDGEGFDSDYNSRNTAIYFNYSHDNEGGFLLLCTPVARRDEENLGNNGTVVRMNISRHDKTRTFHLAGASNSLIERNVIYIAKGDDVQAILVTDWDGWSDGAVFRGNRFVAEGTARYGHQIKRDEGVYEIGAGWGPATHFEFDRNDYSGTHIDPPADYATGDLPTIKSDTDWTGPAFAPSRPEGFGAYLAAHRQWMLDLMAKEFGRMPQLLNPAPTGDPLARRKP